MKKIATHKRILGAYKEKLAPVQQMKLDKWIKLRISKNPHKLGVNLKNHTCTYNLWQLTGESCVYTVVAISRVRVKSTKDFVSLFLTMEAIRKTYDICINPNDPPRIVRPTGRLTKRRKEAIQPRAPTNGHKVRMTFQVTCSKCEEKGDYFKTCKEAPKNPNWQPKRKK
ncbi:hypothetical protein Ahy_B04g073032 [Arachis hypogaea]|uniref:Uncharacterized protein n=1 Tax=Arachis hypogaea TaxID=3818 RepID=A0A444ZPD6_ARAHY|nr:hypothetical protein Ahy_B04g073032 [Arachis hypogaea]